MNRKTVYFTAPRRVELREESLPALGAEDVLVETTCSAISAGTEMLVYRGQFPHLIDSHDNFSSDLNYPLAYGYSCVGRIKETGKQVDRSLLDKLVFGFQPHTSAFICQPSALIFAPDSFPAEACTFLPNMETAVNLIQDECRRKASRQIGANGSYDPVSFKENFSKPNLSYQPAHAQNNKFDLTFELSGRPETLNDALALTTFSGRIVIGSWYGEKKAPIDLGGAFHRSRIKMISSQVSSIAPELSGRWDKARRFDVAWKALERIQPEKWITHRFPIEEAAQAYELLDKNPQETIQVLFKHKT